MINKSIKNFSITSIWRNSLQKIGFLKIYQIVEDFKDLGHPLLLRDYTNSEQNKHGCLKYDLF